MNLSSTKLDTYNTCAYKYKLQYVLKKKGIEEKNTSFEVGNLIHKVMESYREGLDITEIYEHHKNNYVLSDFDESIIKEMLVTAVEMYQPYIGLLYDSEKKYTCALDPQLSINGIIDKMYFHNPDFPKDGKYKISVIDFKTGKRKYDNSTQMKFYITLIYKNLGILPEEIECKVFYLRLKEIIPYKFDQADINEFITYLRMVSEVIDKRQSYKYKFGYYCKWCKYKLSDCEFYKNKLLLEQKNKGVIDENSNPQSI